MIIDWSLSEKQSSYEFISLSMMTINNVAYSVTVYDTWVLPERGTTWVMPAAY